jgi:hypothetical protein
MIPATRFHLFVSVMMSCLLLRSDRTPFSNASFSRWAAKLLTVDTAPQQNDYGASLLDATRHAPRQWRSIKKRPHDRE